MAQPSQTNAEVTPITTVSTLSRLLGQAGALLVEAGALLAATELDGDEPSFASMLAHVPMGTPTEWEAAQATVAAAAEGEGGVAGGGRGGSVPGSPPRGKIFSQQNGPLDAVEERLLLGVAEDEVAGGLARLERVDPLGKSVPSPWLRVPGGGAS